MDHPASLPLPVRKEEHSEVEDCPGEDSPPASEAELHLEEDTEEHAKSIRSEEDRGVVLIEALFEVAVASLHQVGVARHQIIAKIEPPIVIGVGSLAISAGSVKNSPSITQRNALCVPILIHLDSQCSIQEPSVHM